MGNGTVSVTTNPVEIYYQQTLPLSLKTIFKIPEDVLKYWAIGFLEARRIIGAGTVRKLINITRFDFPFI